MCMYLTADLLSGIGLAITAALCQTGALHVYILGRRISALQEAASNFPNTAIPIECDVTNPTSVSAAVSQIQQEVGYVDVLINNAGILGPDHKAVHNAETIEDLQSILLGNWEGWESTFAVNSSAVVGVPAAFLKLLDAGNQRRGWQGGKVSASEIRQRQTVEELKTKGIDMDDQRSSQIITTASIAGFNRYSTAGLAYGGSKAAAIHLSKMLAHLLVPWGIRSNVINPGGEFTLLCALCFGKTFVLHVEYCIKLKCAYSLTRS